MNAITLVKSAGRLAAVGGLVGIVAACGPGPKVHVGPEVKEVRLLSINSNGDYSMHFELQGLGRGNVAVIQATGRMLTVRYGGDGFFVSANGDCAGNTTDYQTKKDGPLHGRAENPALALRIDNYTKEVAKKLGIQPNCELKQAGSGEQK